jgi:hypothetical protein
VESVTSITRLSKSVVPTISATTCFVRVSGKMRVRSIIAWLAAYLTRRVIPTSKFFDPKA